MEILFFYGVADTDGKPSCRQELISVITMNSSLYLPVTGSNKQIMMKKTKVTKLNSQEKQWESGFSSIGFVK